jgi:hypothetical protein
MEKPPETEEEIAEEMKELGIDNDATGRPDVMLSGQLVKVIAGLLAVLLVLGLVLLVF